METEQRQLLETAQSAPAQRAGSTVYRGDGVRQTMVALLAGAEMGEHESPLEAFIHVLAGRVSINGDDRTWELSKGQLFPMPPEKHSVTALEDSVLTLTVLRQAAINTS